MDGDVNLKKYIVIFGVSFLVFFGILGGIYYFLDKTHEQMQDPDFEASIVDNPELKPPESKNDVVVNALVLGVNQGLSDIMQVVRYNKENHKIAVISIPRDTRVNYTYLSKGKPKSVTDKINSVVSKDDGTALVMKTVGDLLNIPIHHYVRVNLVGAERIVDTIGGVKINVPFHMYYVDEYQDLYIDIPKGDQVLDGKNAVHFVRYRSGYPDQDLGRIKAQHEFIKAFVRKLTSPSILPKAPALLTTMSKHIKTNLDESDITKYAVNVKNISLENIAQYTVPGNALKINGIAYFIHNKNLLDELLKEVNLVLGVDENAVAVSQGTPNSADMNQNLVKKKDIKVEILNSTKENGLASALKTQLEALGYSVVKIGDTKDLTFSSSRLINRNGSEEWASLLAVDSGIPNIDTDIDSSHGCDITIIIGKDMIKK